MFHRAHALVAGGAAVATVLLVACTQATSSDRLLDPSDFPDPAVRGSEGSFVESHLWCTGLSMANTDASDDVLALVQDDDGERYGALLIGGVEGSGGAAARTDAMLGAGTVCATNASGTETMEPIEGLGEGATAWRLGDASGTKGEVAIAELDPRRTLVVGITTAGGEPAVSLADLLAMARENVEAMTSD